MPGLFATTTLWSPAAPLLEGGGQRHLLPNGASASRPDDGLREREGVNLVHANASVRTSAARVWLGVAQSRWPPTGRERPPVPELRTGDTVRRWRGERRAQPVEATAHPVEVGPTVLMIVGRVDAAAAADMRAHGSFVQLRQGGDDLGERVPYQRRHLFGRTSSRRGENWP